MLRAHQKINRLLYDIRGRLLQVEKISLLNFKSLEAWTASDFREMQDSHQNWIVSSIETIVDDIKYLTAEACNSVLVSAGCPFHTESDLENRANNYWRNAAQRRSICVRFLKLFKLSQLMVEQELNNSINRYARCLLGCLEGHFDVNDFVEV